MKKCIICEIEKPDIHFPVTKFNSPGTCRECVKERADNRIKRLRDDPEWVKKERERTREKYHRLNYKQKKPLKDAVEKSNKAYKAKYPEKFLAKNAAQRIECPEGFHRHHWSYHPDNHKDVIIVEESGHYYLHRHMIYDQERGGYRNNNGVLLSKAKQVRLLDECGFKVIMPF